jgi:hypothetical protein
VLAPRGAGDRPRQRKSASNVTSKPRFLSDFAKLREHLNSAGRGLRADWATTRARAGREYHGKMPRGTPPAGAARQIATGGQQSLGFIEYLLERRKPFAVAIRAQAT